MPYAGMTLIFIWALMRSLPVISFAKRDYLFLVLGILALGLLDWNREVIAKEEKAQMLCRPEGKIVLGKIKDIQTNTQGILLHEPFFPFDANKDLNKTSWGLSFEEIDRVNPGLIGMRGIKMYLHSPPAFFDDVRKEGWAEKQRFYQTIKNLLTLPHRMANTFV